MLTLSGTFMHDTGENAARGCLGFRHGRRLGLLVLGALLAGLYVGVLVLSRSFAADEPGRPILETVGLLVAATILYLAALGLVFRDGGESERGTLSIVLGYSFLFRLVLLTSTPILEIDFYRYLWDGRVLSHGFNPYRYSPFQVEDAEAEASEELAELSRLSGQSAALREIFNRVHYREVPTVYPPAAQAVFAGAALLTPADASTATHVLVLKAILVGFDLATLGVLAGLLRVVGLPAGWCLAYGWCPLVLKEIANSGHLDSIAVFFSVLAVFLSIAAVRSGWGLLLVLAGAAALALAVLAKTYPLVLLPVLGAFLMARWRGWALFPLAVFVGILVAGYLPFCGPAPGDPDRAPSHHPGSGLATFLTQWESNDFLFVLVYHNLRQPEADPPRWFVVAPASWRTSLHERLLDPLREATELSPRVNPAFVLSQGIMGLILLVLCLRWAGQVYRVPEPTLLLRCVFRSLVWCWLLGSAQNPWYLLWCLPFAVFDGRLGWFLLPGLALLYYVRFWIAERSATAEAFDFGWVWLEYAPFFFWLAVESWRQARAAAVGPRAA